jgi:hypothetical protein
MDAHCVAEAESMAFTKKLKWIILPALLVIGLGVLEINFSHAMDGFSGSHTGGSLARHGNAGGLVLIVLLLFELFVWLTWSKIGGAIAILLGTTAIVLCVLPKTEHLEAKPTQSSVTEDDKSLTNNALASLLFHAGKNYVQQRLENRQP